MTFRTITADEARVIMDNEESDFLPFQFINSTGLAEIHTFLGERHKKGHQHFTTDMLHAWAAEAEFQLSEGNTPTIEIKSSDTISGHSETLTVSSAGVEWGIND